MRLCLHSVVVITDAQGLSGIPLSDVTTAARPSAAARLSAPANLFCT